MTHDELTPSERLRRVAAILAKGVLRYHERIGRSESRTRAACPESASDCLDLLGETRLTVPRRVRG